MTAAALTPVVSGQDVPEVIRERIAALFVDVRDLHRVVCDVASRYTALDGALDALGDGVDDRSYDLCVETGLGAVFELLGDIAYRCEGATSCGAQALDKPVGLLWPPTGGELPEREL